MFQKIRYFFCLSLLISQVLFPTLTFAQDFPSVDEVASQIEERYHINKENVQGFGENSNVSKQKAQTPQVNLFFTPNTPAPGKEITAQANATFFSGGKEQLYFGWYLKHEKCDLTSSLNKDNTFCDLDDDNKITVNDWKIEAMRTLASKEFETTRANYESPVKGDKENDDDGYKGIFGGDKSTGNKRCYAQDYTSGILFEIAKPDVTQGSSSSTSPTSATSLCDHYFAQRFFTERPVGEPPSPPGNGKDVIGDGEFGRSEEKFWQTDPTDPNTAGPGRGDEANIVGVGQNSFTWTYMVGDTVGVLIEGTASVTTKHEDHSFAIMWALPKNICKPTPTVPPFYTKQIKGYPVKIPTATINFDECIPDALIDPREGGQTQKMEVSLGYGPETVSNDSSGDGFGNVITVSSSVDNANSAENLLKYDWKVFISKDGSYDPRQYTSVADPTTAGDPTGLWVDITKFLEKNQFITFTSGNGLNDIAINLNLTNDLFRTYGKKADGTEDTSVTDPNKDEIRKLRVSGTPPVIFDSGGTGYLKVLNTVKENIDTDGSTPRTDRAPIIIPILSTNLDIIATHVAFEPAPDNRLKIKKRANGEDDVICNEPLNTDKDSKDYNPIGLGKNLCLVAKNELFGLKISDATNLKDFQWTVDSQPLNCTDAMSKSCSSSSPTAYNFFPIMEDVGHSYVIGLTAINVETGKKVSLSRSFQVINPYAAIRTANKDLAWQKYLGYYKGTDGYAYEDLSPTQFQAFPGARPSFSVQFFPSWIKDRPKASWVWTVNGTVASQDKRLENIALPPLSENPGDLYTITVSGQSTEDDAIRNALATYWKYTPLESIEHTFSQSIQLQIIASEEELDALASPKSFFAAVAKNAPQQVLFIAQLFLSLFVIIVLMGFLFSLGRRDQE